METRIKVKEQISKLYNYLWILFILEGILIIGLFIFNFTIPNWTKSSFITFVIIFGILIPVVETGSFLRFLKQRRQYN